MPTINVIMLHHRAVPMTPENEDVRNKRIEMEKATVTQTTDKTPAQMKAAARAMVLTLIADPSTGFATVEHMDPFDAYARACIDEAVAPALNRIDELLTRYMGTRAEELHEIRKLLGAQPAPTASAKTATPALDKYLDATENGWRNIDDIKRAVASDTAGLSAELEAAMVAAANWQTSYDKACRERDSLAEQYRQACIESDRWESEAKNAAQPAPQEGAPLVSATVAAAVEQALYEQPPGEHECKRCGEGYIMDCGDETTALCNHCAQEIVVILANVLNRARMPATREPTRGG